MACALVRALAPEDGAPPFPAGSPEPHHPPRPLTDTLPTPTEGQERPSWEELEAEARERFGVEDFRPGQRDIERAAGHFDVPPPPRPTTPAATL